MLEFSDAEKANSVNGENTPCCIQFFKIPEPYIIKPFAE